MKEIFVNRHPVLIYGIGMYQNFTLADFSQMNIIKSEMAQFLNKYDINKSVLGKSNWPDFIHQLVNILADQAIVKPCEGIELFRFKPSPFGVVIVEIVYAHGTISPELQEFCVAY